MAKSRDYWADRFNLLQETELGKADDYVQSMEKFYRRAMTDIERDISTWYGRFADNEQITLTEANRLLNTRELEEFRWTVDEYIKAGQENAIDQRWIKQLENASARVHVRRLEALKLQMQQHIEVLYGQQQDDLDKLMGNLYQERYYHTAYETQLGFNTGWRIDSLNPALIESVLKKPWAPDGINFSSRVWNNRSKLVSLLHTELTQSIIRGEKPARMIKTISEQMGVSRRAAGRLVMTEAAFFASAGQQKAYSDLDIEQYEYMATLDKKTSDICQEMDGKVFPMDQYQVGVTAPPLHVFCRSVTSPWFEDNYGERAARGDDGKTYFVPADTTYKDWKAGLVGGGPVKGFEPILEIKPPRTTTMIAQEIATSAALQGGAELNGIPVEVAEKIQERYNRVMDRYPQLIGQFRSLGTAETRGNVYASCSSYSGRINVNPKYFADEAKLIKSYDNDLGSGFHPKDTDGYSIITHEIGHAVDGFMTRNGVGDFTSMFNMKDASFTIRKRALKELKLTKNDIRRGVSGYGTKNDAEFFAEAFSEYMDSPTPRPIAKKVGEIVDELMGKIRRGEMKK